MHITSTSKHIFKHMSEIALRELRLIIKETLEHAIEEEVEDLTYEPEFRNIDSFVQYKIDNEEDSFSFIELQALSRSTYRQLPDVPDVALASKRHVDEIKSELMSYGLNYVPRAPIKNVRGIQSPMHGTCRYKGNCAGTGTNIGGWIGIGGGKGSIGGEDAWSARDSRNLPMGSTRKR